MFTHSAAAMVCGVGLGWFIYVHAGGPQEWDDLLYLELALNPDEHPWLLHRYIHIALLRWSVLLTGDALQGARMYWALMYAVTVVAVYLGARLLAVRDRSLIGVIGVLLFVGLSGLIQLAGVPFADFTVMMLVSVVVALYTAWCGLRDKPLQGVTMAGLIIALSGAAVFSKETGVILLIPVIALSWYYVKAATSSPLLGSPVVLLGVAVIVAGLGLYLVIAAIGGPQLSLPGSALIDLNVRRVQAVLANIGRYELMWDSYYTFSLQAYPVLFVAYLIAILKWTHEGGVNSVKVSWFLPVALLVFLTTVSMGTDWGIQPRYLFPMLPVLAIWGAQIFQRPASNEALSSEPLRQSQTSFRLTEKKLMDRLSERIRNIASLTSANMRRLTDGAFVLTALAGIAIFLWLTLRPMSEFVADSKWTRDQIYETIVLPISALVIFSIVLTMRYWSKLSLLALAVATIALLGPRVDTQVWLLRSGKVAAETNDRFRWLESLKGNVDINHATKVFISENLYEQYEIGGRSDGSSTRMINIYFNIDIPETSVEQSADLAKLDANTYDVVLLTTDEWEKLRGRETASLYLHRELRGAVPEMVILERK